MYYLTNLIHGKAPMDESPPNPIRGDWLIDPEQLCTTDIINLFTVAKSSAAALNSISKYGVILRKFEFIHHIVRT